MSNISAVTSFDTSTQNVDESLDLTQKEAYNALKVNELISALFNLEIEERRCKIRFSMFSRICNSRREVQLLESVISQLTQLPSENEITHYGITRIKQQVRCIERIFRRISYNNYLPSFMAGLPNDRWDKHMVIALKLEIGKNWEARLEEIGLNQFEKSSDFIEYRHRINDEFQRWKIETIHYCRVEKIDRENTARWFELLVFLTSSMLGLCVPVLVGLAVYKYLDD